MKSIFFMISGFSAEKGWRDKTKPICFFDAACVCGRGSTRRKDETNLFFSCGTAVRRRKHVETA